MNFGYARISTKDQSLEIQLNQLAEACCELLLEKKISGASRKRSKFEALLEQVRKGDVLVVTKLERLARSTTELLRVAEVQNKKSTILQSLEKPWADTETPAGKMIMTVFGGIAEFEKLLILARTQERREAAQDCGLAFDRPGKLKHDQKKLARELVKEGQSICSAARTFNIHTATIYRCLNENKPL